MVTKAEKLEKTAKRDLESAYLGLEMHVRWLNELGTVSKKNAYQIMVQLDHLADHHQQIALKHWRSGERHETLDHVSKILSASRDAAGTVSKSL